jgi:hypothetical protein
MLKRKSKNRHFQEVIKELREDNAALKSSIQYLKNESVGVVELHDKHIETRAWKNISFLLLVSFIASIVWVGLLLDEVEELRTNNVKTEIRK